MFKFAMKATQCDPSGYYFPRWDNAQSIAVIAESAEHAQQIACNVLGSTPRRGWYWIFKITKIEQVKDGAA